MRIAFAGTPDVACPALKRLVESYEIVGVITRADAKAGRGKKLTPSPVARCAEEYGLDVAKVSNREELREAIKRYRPDLVIVVAFGMLVSQDLLDACPMGWVNLHFSLLPKWRGAAPAQYAIWHGDEMTGVTTFRLVQQLDAGPIYRQAAVPIEPQMTSGDLLESLSLRGADLLIETVQAIEAGEQPYDQEGDPGLYAGKITPDDVHIDWTRPALSIERLIRAAHPHPMAWTMRDGQRVKIVSAHLGESSSLEPGVLHVEKKTLSVGTSDGDLILDMVQPAGKKMMAAIDWARGLRLTTGEKFDG